MFEEMLKKRLPVASLLAFILWLSALSALSALPMDVCASDDANAAKRLAACGKALSDKKLSDEDRASALHYRAAIYDDMGKYPEALKDIQASVELDPSCEGYWLLGVVHEVMKQKDSARKAWEEALEDESVWECELLPDLIKGVKDLGGTLPEPPELDIGGGGSLLLDEVEGNFTDDDSAAAKKLLAEIKSELRRQNLDAGDVGCDARLILGNWTSYRLMRVAPFSCEVGDKTLVIDGDIELVDEEGKTVDAHAPGVHLRDDLGIRYNSLTWKWR
jgi:tetratricopeptide (TPR) repeat protein